MTSRVFLHVGLPKSGTSYLQKLLSANQARLRDQAGLLFPGDDWSDQVIAVRDVRGLYDDRARTRVEGRWDRLVEEILDWSGDSIVSMEWLCAAGDQQIARILASFPGREVEVVFTVRDLARTLPAAWQEFMQNRQTWTWEEFLHGVREPESTNTGGKAFWAQQHLPRLLDRWGTHLPAARIHVVTLPQPGAERDLLWQRVAGVLGVDPAGASTQDLGGNESLGLQSAELMRRVNLALAEQGGAARGYNPQFKHRLAKEVLASRRASESTLALPAAVHEWACGVAEEHIEAVRSSGVDLVGDLAELRPSAAKDGRRPEEVDDAELLDTAVAALIELARSPGGPAKQGPIKPSRPQRAVSTGSSGPSGPSAAQPPRSARRGIAGVVRRLTNRD